MTEWLPDRDSRHDYPAFLSPVLHVRSGATSFAGLFLWTVDPPPNDSGISVRQLIALLNVMRRISSSFDVLYAMSHPEMRQLSLQSILMTPRCTLDHLLLKIDYAIADSWTAQRISASTQQSNIYLLAHALNLLYSEVGTELTADDRISSPYRLLSNSTACFVSICMPGLTAARATTIACGASWRYINALPLRSLAMSCRWRASRFRRCAIELRRLRIECIAGAIRRRRYSIL